MNVQEAYTQMNGDYNGVIGRLRDDARVTKFLKKFVDNRMDVLIKDALSAGDYETAFRESHNLKGVCANLSIDALQKSASELTEALRGGEPKGDITPLVDAMQKDYDITINAINGISEE